MRKPNSMSRDPGHNPRVGLQLRASIFALAMVDRQAHQGLIHNGLAWLAANRNDDGGWGDTIQSASNISTTVLCWSAFAGDEHFADVCIDAENWLVRVAGGVICAAVEYGGGSERQALETIEDKISRNVRAVLEDSQRTGATPREAAVALAEERVRSASRFRRWHSES